MRIPPNLRINADDFGLSPGISRSILEAASEGLVNSISVVPFEDAESQLVFDRLLALPGIRIGAHLTFIELPLLTRPKAFADGLPPVDHKQFLVACLQGKVRLDEVRLEWNAQLDLLASRIGSSRIHHLDSHQHLHLLPGLWNVTCELRHERGVPVLRCPHEPTLRAWLKDLPMGAGLQLLSRLRASSSSETFFGVGSSMGFRADRYLGFAHAIRAQPARAFELMIHPDETSRGQRELEEIRGFLSKLGS